MSVEHLGHVEMEEMNSMEHPHQVEKEGGAREVLCQAEMEEVAREHPGLEG